MVHDKVASFDASTPLQYDAQNSGFIGFHPSGDGIITSNARDRYNTLIFLYKDAFFLKKAIKLKVDIGITPFKDEFNNELFLISREYITYFGILNGWLKNNYPIDKQD